MDRYILLLSEHAFFLQVVLLFTETLSQANALDDYEEGVYDPNLRDASGVAAFNDNPNVKLRYTKIGNICHVHGRILEN